MNSMELFMRNGVTFDALALHEQEEGREEEGGSEGSRLARAYNKFEAAD